MSAERYTISIVECSLEPHILLADRRRERAPIKRGFLRRLLGA